MIATMATGIRARKKWGESWTFWAGYRWASGENFWWGDSRDNQNELVGSLGFTSGHCVANSDLPGPPLRSRGACRAPTPVGVPVAPNVRLFANQTIVPSQRQRSAYSPSCQRRLASILPVAHWLPQKWIPASAGMTTKTMLRVMFDKSGSGSGLLAIRIMVLDR